MPKLLAFFPCEKVLIDASTNAVSALNIMQDVQFLVPDTISLPADATAPMAWTIFSMWERDEKEGNSTFRVRAECRLSSGKIAFTVESEDIDFEGFTKRSQRVITQIQGFPIGEIGKIDVRLMLRMGASPEFVEVATYPLLLTRHGETSSEQASVNQHPGVMPRPAH